MVDNSLYIKKLVKLLIVFIVIIALIGAAFVAANDLLNPKEKIEKTTADHSVKTGSDTNVHNPSKIDADSIQKDLAYNGDLKIDKSETIGEWSIIVVSPKNQSTDPALLIYKKTGDSYKRVVGPGTSFTKEYLQFIEIPDEVIMNNIVKGYVSG